MNDRNCERCQNLFRKSAKRTDLQTRIPLLLLKLIPPKHVQPPLRLVGTEPILIALQQLEDIVDDYRLEVKLLLVVDVLRLFCKWRLGS